MHSHNQIQKFKKSIVCCSVVPGNGQVLLGMPDTAVLNILKLNIDSIQAEIMKLQKQTGGRKHTRWMEGCTNINTVGITKQKANGQNQSNMLIKYLYLS